jgi:hypothetical protein
VRRGGGAVDRDLHAVDAERGDPVGGGVVDAAAVGLELERDAAAARRSNTSQLCATPSGSPPPKAT